MFDVRHWWGKQEKTWPIEKLGEIVDELAQADKGDIAWLEKQPWKKGY